MNALFYCYNAIKIGAKNKQLILLKFLKSHLAQIQLLGKISNYLAFLTTIVIFMNDKEKFETLFAVCKSLAEAGQTPSVGILRGKAPFKVSVLEAIEVIKRFNQHQQLEAEKPAPKALSDKERIVELEARVSQLEQAIGVIEARLAKLDV